MDGPRILVCCVGTDPARQAEARRDAEAFGAHYASVEEAIVADRQQLLRLLAGGRWHIVHLVMDLHDPDDGGGVTDQAVAAALRATGALNVHFAGANDWPSYRAAFFSGKRVTIPANVLFCLDRKGAAFPETLSRIFGHAAAGKAFAVAFAKVCPQVPPHLRANSDRPDMLLVAPAAHVVFRAAPAAAGRGRAA